MNRIFLCFIWPDQIDSALTHLSMHGVKVEVVPVKRFGSRGHGTRVYFRDPDGSLMELISYVDAPADDPLAGD